jgi:ferredoxin--NADP+ reductase
MRFWLRPVEIEESSSGTVAGLRLERTRISKSGQFEGTGEFETVEAQLVLRSVGYQSVPLAGVPFDTRSCTVPNIRGRVLSEAGEPLPGEYVAGWLKRGPTGVIGTNKADAAETVQALLADLAGGPDVGEGALPRPGLLRRPDEDPAIPGDPDVLALAAVLEARGVAPVSYADWLRISAAEEELAASLGRGDRVKLPHGDALWTAAGRAPGHDGHLRRQAITILPSSVTVRKNVITPRHDGVTARSQWSGSARRRPNVDRRTSAAKGT